MNIFIVKVHKLKITDFEFSLCLYYFNTKPTNCYHSRVWCNISVQIVL